MAEHTAIEWADATLNWWEGCTKVSQGCKNCYAESLAKRYGKEHWGPAPRRLVLSTMDVLKKICKRIDAGDVSKNGTKTLMVFVNDISDTFEDFEGKIVHPNGMQFFTDDLAIFTQSVLSSRHREGRPLTLDDVRKQLFMTVEFHPHIVFQVLTKRPENILRMVPGHWHNEWPKNVWIGTSVEDQKTADERIPHLLKVAAAVRFLSCEPLLGPVALNNRVGWLRGFDGSVSGAIRWVICGGESGAKARPMDVTWVYDLKKQCEAATVPIFIKQLGKSFYHSGYRDGEDLITAGAKGSDWEHFNFPDDLKVREFPEVTNG